ncbi:putative cytochrome P450 oxidoreductase [Westerdykella ornata]|uniref:Putative cytochrome P450 oxidoreductase n=1 Tax=Westerdykella ornata TaxID=318751 RepID=A0A6A6J5Q3_WESOR|nr:putative cytochrome P450 oxidoreductase [Westerdykella ornata]KAF2271298.1 putative cytochrome P450 oxidoreductase [Westerdykella ornata]
MENIYLIVIALLALLCEITRRAFPQPYPKIPYHKVSSKRIWGDVPAMMKAIKISEDPSRFVFQQCRTLGSPVVQLFFGPFTKPAIFVDDVREVKDILSFRTREFDRSYKSQDTLRPMLRHSSLVKATGPEFKAQRKLWEGFMGMSFIRRVAAPEMHRVALELIELLRTKAKIAGGRPVYFFTDLDLAAFDIIWKVVFGNDLNGVRGEHEGILKGSGQIKQPMSMDSVAEMPMVPKPEMYTTVCFVIKGIEQTFTTYFQRFNHWLVRHGSAYKRKWDSKQRIVDERINGEHARLSKLSRSALLDTEETSGVVLGVRRYLLAQEGDLGASKNIPSTTQQEIHNELMMLLMAGHETNASALSWAIKYLAAHPSKQARLHDSLLEGFSERVHGAQPTVDAILSRSIPYLDACMEETLRHATISSRLARVATMNTELFGYRIPGGASVMLSPYVGAAPFNVPEAHRSLSSQRTKDNYPLLHESSDMDVWELERWLADDGSFDGRRYPRLAFSAGPRACYGKILAMQEFRIILALLVLNFEFAAAPGELASLAAHQRILKVPRHCHVRLITRS